LYLSVSHLFLIFQKFNAHIKGPDEPPMDWPRFQAMLDDVQSGVSSVEALNIFRESISSTNEDQAQGDDFSAIAVYFELDPLRDHADSSTHSSVH
jgi:hypothetical protein